MPSVFNLQSGASTASAKTLGDLKREIGRVAGAQDNPDEVGAQVAVEMALSKIFETNWDFYITLTTQATSVGVAELQLPDGVRDIQLVRVTTGNERTLKQIRYDEYSRAVPNQSGLSTPMYYSLQKLGTSSVLWVHPGPASAEVFDVWYFREPVWPAQDQDIVDIPKFLERPVILLGRVEVATNTTTFPATRLQILMGQAEDALRGARGRDRVPFDFDVVIRPGSDEAFPNWPWDHPNRSSDE